MAEDKQRTPVLQARNISKRFGSVTALEHVDFELYPDEILALVGDNGAGKSTLIKILSGAYQPDEGETLMDGQRVHFHNPMEARRLGIEQSGQKYRLGRRFSPPHRLARPDERRKIERFGHHHPNRNF